MGRPPRRFCGSRGAGGAAGTAARIRHESPDRRGLGEREDAEESRALTLLAGGRASGELRAILEQDGGTGITKRLRWLGGGPREAPQVQWVSWERDPWSRGGYAVLQPGVRPGAARSALSRGTGRLLFAGAHTSREFQGYMNGAVESGLRAAAEVASLERLRRTRA